MRNLIYKSRPVEPNPASYGGQRINEFIVMSEAFSNAYLIETPEGCVQLNAGMGMEAPVIEANFREFTDVPVHTLIFTQGHVDHVGGTAYFRDKNPGLRVIATDKFTEHQAYDTRLANFRGNRSAFAFTDKFANASDQEKRLSMQQTSWINEAQTTLKDPVLRATYLLKLKGVDINLENETTMDAGFLMQQLEMRERLENISSEADPLDALDALAKETRANMDEVMQGFADSYEADRLDESREWVRKLQFMQKAIKEINTSTAKIEDELMG